MRRVRFHKELYRGEAVDEAVRAYERFARFERSEAQDAWVVELSCKTPARERAVVGELSNYALGATIKGRGGAR